MKEKITKYENFNEFIEAFLPDEEVLLFVTKKAIAQDLKNEIQQLISEREVEFMLRRMKA